jgi:phosphoheptose isomerase
MESFSLTGFDGGKLRTLMNENNVHVPSKNGQYGLVEDAHLAICHIATECIRKIK